jgi:hypothetical protein
VFPVLSFASHSEKWDLHVCHSPESLSLNDVVVSPCGGKVEMVQIGKSDNTCVRAKLGLRDNGCSFYSIVCIILKCVKAKNQRIQHIHKLQFIPIGSRFGLGSNRFGRTNLSPNLEPNFLQPPRTELEQNSNLRFGSAVRGSNRGSGPNFGNPIHAALFPSRPRLLRTPHLHCFWGYVSSLVWW